MPKGDLYQTLRFQSTLPSRGATRLRPSWPGCRSGFQSTLPSRGATALGVFAGNMMTFQSTLPSRGATEDVSHREAIREISIHAPLAGSDGEMMNAGATLDISIHAPLAGSDAGGAQRKEDQVFQSTLPSRGATVKQTNITSCFVIKIACFPRYVQRSR